MCGTSVQENSPNLFTAIIMFMPSKNTLINNVLCVPYQPYFFRSLIIIKGGAMIRNNYTTAQLLYKFAVK